MNGQIFERIEHMVAHYYGIRRAFYYCYAFYVSTIRIRKMKNKKKDSWNIPVT